MDKDKIIEDILNEWAMRSPDGLVGGHDTPENMSIFETVLIDRGIHVNEVDTLVEQIFGAIGEKKLTKKPMTLWEHLGSPEGKNVRPDDLEYMRRAIERLDKAGKFRKMYNKLSLRRSANGFPSAIDVYGDKNFSDLINKIDKRERKGLGRGELVFIFLLKGVKSGGTSDADLLYAEDEGVVEMKELTGKSKKRVIKISAATLQDYSTSDFKGAVDDLTVELRKNKELGPFLVRVLSEETLYPTTKTITSNHKKSVGQFVEELRTNEMPASLFNGLMVIGDKLKIASKKVDVTKPALASASVTIHDKKQEFKIDNPQEVGREMKNIEINPKKNNALNLKVSFGATKSDAELEQIARNLEYFKRGYSIPKISSELNKLVAGNYTGILVIDKRNNQNKAEYLPSGTKFTFVGITMGGIKLSYEPNETADTADTAEKSK